MSDLLEKEKAYREKENEADDDNDSNDSSDQEGTDLEQSQSESIDVESDSEPDHEQVIQKNPRNPVIIVKLECVCICGGKCPSCFWHDKNYICPVCGYEIPVDAEHVKESFARCSECGAFKHKNKNIESQLIFSR